MDFTVTDDDCAKVDEWAMTHDCPLLHNVTAIGGRLTYEFTPTGCGVIAKVVCQCGEELNLTHYDEW